jgi:hypothetical protein
MKLRIHNDSVRLRLTVCEVARVERGASVVGRTRFPGGATLTYALVPADVAALDAALAAHRLTVRLPRAQAQAWAEQPQQIALRGRVDLARGDKLNVLVEKDFACVVPRVGEDAGDLFVNPRAQKSPAPP